MRWLLFMVGMGMLAFASCKKDDVTSSVSAQAVIDDALIKEYMTQNSLTDFKQAIKDSTGLYYEIVKDTSDATLYSSSTLITVGYTGSYLTKSGGTITAKQFIATNEYHPSFTLGEVIRGWRLCIPKCNKGGVIRIIMASRYAYGSVDNTGSGTIGLPANSVLDFTINLYDVAN